MKGCVTLDVVAPVENPVGGPVVVFRSGRGCPIFLVAGMGGSAEGFGYLAEQIASRHPGQDHPIYGLNRLDAQNPAPGLMVESVAAQQAGEVEKMVPRGRKVILAGHSFGGTVAFEMARQLRQSGWDPLPVVIDMSAINAPGRLPRTRTRHALDVLRNLPPWLLYEAANFNLRRFRIRLQGHLSRAIRVAAGRPGAEELDMRIFTGETNVPEASAAVLRTMFAVMRAYRSKPFDGRVVLLRARVPLLSRGRDPLMGWTTVAGGGVERHLIAGKHGDCLADRHAPRLADLIARCAAQFAAE